MDNQTLPSVQNDVAVVKYSGPKHTPGPWRAIDWCERYPLKDETGIPTKRGEYFWIQKSDGSETVSGWMGEVDARLIAAAPTMLAALQSVDALWNCDALNFADEMHWETPVGKSWALVRAAIAKATGGA